jgi:hypothetical protein
MTAARRPLPLRIAGRRFWLWSVGLAVASAILIVGAPFNRFVDFPQFWFAGKIVGSPDLLDPARQTVWELARGFTPWQFLYPPGTAWLYSPLGFLPMAAAFWVHAVVIALAGAAAGFIGARTYGLDSAVGIIAALA